MLLFAMQTMQVKQTLLEGYMHVKKFLLLLSSFIPLWLIPFLILLQQSWSWYQLMQGFLGGWIPFHLLGQPLHCTSHLGSNCR